MHNLPCHNAPPPTCLYILHTLITLVVINFDAHLHTLEGTDVCAITPALVLALSMDFYGLERDTNVECLSLLDFQFLHASHPIAQTPYL